MKMALQVDYARIANKILQQLYTNAYTEQIINMVHTVELQNM